MKQVSSGETILYTHLCPKGDWDEIELPGEHMEAVYVPSGNRISDEITCSRSGLPMTRMSTTDPEREQTILEEFSQRNRNARFLRENEARGKKE